MIAGIVADNYKVKKFMELLGQKPYEFTINPFKDDTSLIKVTYHTEEEKKELALLCKTVEIYYERKN